MNLRKYNRVFTIYKTFTVRSSLWFIKLSPILGIIIWVIFKKLSLCTYQPPNFDRSLSVLGYTYICNSLNKFHVRSIPIIFSLFHGGRVCFSLRVSFRSSRSAFRGISLFSSLFEVEQMFKTFTTNSYFSSLCCYLFIILGETPAHFSVPTIHTFLPFSTTPLTTPHPWIHLKRCSKKSSLIIEMGNHWYWINP